MVTPVAAIAQSGIAAATLKLNASASKLVNASDTSADDTTAPNGGGVIAQAVTVRSPALIVYDPSSAAANARGLAAAPEIDPISEVSNMLAAGRAFAYSVKVLKAADDDEQTLLDLKT